MISAMLRRAVLLLLCLTMPFQAWAVAVWHTGHCVHGAAMTPAADGAVPATITQVAAHQQVPSPTVLAEPAAAMDDLDCCGAAADVGSSCGVGCPGAGACHGVVMALAAAWPRLGGTVPDEAAPPSVGLATPPPPLSVVWRPPILC